MRRVMILSSIVVASFVSSVIPVQGAGPFAFTTTDVPGASVSIAHGVNNAGQIVGAYGDGTGLHGFLRSPAGYYTAIDYSGSVWTEARGINDLGQIVGTFLPPESPRARLFACLRHRQAN